MGTPANVNEGAAIGEPPPQTQLTETLSFDDFEVQDLLTISHTGEMPKAVRDALAKAIQLKQAVADLDRQVNARTQQVNDITAEQNRIRENMKTVAQTGPYYDRLLAKLNEQESTIERLQGERRDLVTRRDAARKDLADYLETLNA